MSVTTLLNTHNTTLPVADKTKGTDYYYPNVNGLTLSVNYQSWELKIDKTGIADGVKYLTLAVEYLFSTGWSQAYSNAPNGWAGGIEFADDGTQSRIDYARAPIYDPTGDPNGERPTKARFHILFSNGSTLANILLQVATDLSLLT